MKLVFSLGQFNLHMQLLPIHFSLRAHTWSDSHRGRHIESRHVFPSVQSKFEAQETGTVKDNFFNFSFPWTFLYKIMDRRANLLRTHSTAGLPVKPAGHEHVLKWLDIRHSEFMPQACGCVHGLTHWLSKQISSRPHSLSKTHAGLQKPPLQYELAGQSLDNEHGTGNGLQPTIVSPGSPPYPGKHLQNPTWLSGEQSELGPQLTFSHTSLHFDSLFDWIHSALDGQSALLLHSNAKRQPSLYGSPTYPLPHAQWNVPLLFEHCANGPQGESRQ